MSNAAVCTRVNLDKMVCDSRYQRPVEEKRVTRIVDNFDPKLLGTLELSKRTNGTFAIIDGQHRFEALKAKGRKQAPALVHDGLSVQQEADLFARTNMSRKPLTPTQRFRAQVFSGDPQSVEISNIVTETGFRITTGKERAAHLGDIRAIASIERVYRRWGADHLELTLKTIAQCWFGEKSATDNSIINGMALFLDQFGGRFTPLHQEALGRTSALTVSRRAQERALGNSGSATLGVQCADEIRRIVGLRNAPLKTKKRELTHA